MIENYITDSVSTQRKWLLDRMLKPMNVEEVVPEENNEIEEEEDIEAI